MRGGEREKIRGAFLLLSSVPYASFPCQALRTPHYHLPTRLPSLSAIVTKTLPMASASLQGGHPAFRIVYSYPEATESLSP